MAKVKGSNPPMTEFAYEDASGLLYYFGEFYRGVFTEGSISPKDPDTDIIGVSRQGERPTQQGDGTEEQKRFREIFQNCTKLWNSLPEDNPEPCPEPGISTKQSVWEAKLEHGVVCSYYDLFMRCCLKWALGHNDKMPDNDCFPCILECINDPAMEWDYDLNPETVAREDNVNIVITGLNAPFTWEVSGTGFTLEHANTEGNSNILHADDTACGSATITVTGCDDRSATGYVRCTTGQWTYIDDGCVLSGVTASFVAGNLWQAISGKYKQLDYVSSLNADGSQHCGTMDVPTACAGFPYPDFCLTIPGCANSLQECGDHCCSNYFCDSGYCQGSITTACPNCNTAGGVCTGLGTWCLCWSYYICITGREAYEWTC